MYKVAYRTIHYHSYIQIFSRLRCLLRVKGLVFCFYLGRSGSILYFRQNIIKEGSKSWLHTCSSNITLSLPSYTGSALKRELNFCNGYLSLLYFWLHITKSYICRMHTMNDMLTQNGHTSRKSSYKINILLDHSYDYFHLNNKSWK